MCFLFVFQAEDGIRDYKVTGVQTCALPICPGLYQVRVAARDALSGRVGTAKSWIQIPDLSAKKLTLSSLRSEERRVGKERRAGEGGDVVKANKKRRTQQADARKDIGM